MITVKDLNDIAENKIKNEVQKEIIRSSFPPHIADRMCAAIDGQECKKRGRWCQCIGIRRRMKVSCSSVVHTCLCRRGERGIIMNRRIDTMET